jgi:Fic family protein
MSAPPTFLKVYDQPHQFEPLLPQRELDVLALQSREVVEQSLKLQGSSHPSTRFAIAELVRSMNSYYSNLIEGQSTHPKNIDRALAEDFSEKPDIARKQRIAVAHITAERELEAGGIAEEQVLTGDYLRRTHERFFGHLAEADRMVEDRVVVPGALREEDVQVFRHQPPTWKSVPQFLEYADRIYGKRWGLDSLLVGIASAHQRLAWVHPFLDGNGRACRLQTHMALMPLSGGLWSVNRGFARERPRYYEHLSNADMARHGDLDGRGNLSERMLREWCEYFIATCKDQVNFMSRMLDLEGFKERMAGLIAVRSKEADKNYREEAVLPMHHVIAVGPVSRGDFNRMLGLGERSGRTVIAQLLKDGLLVSDTPKGDLRIGLPLDALNILLPNLYPEASTQAID